MSNNHDANIKLLYPVDKNLFFTVDDIGLGKEFDCILNVEMGEDVHEVLTGDRVRVGIVNLTQSKAVGPVQDIPRALPPGTGPRLEEIRVEIPGGWEADAAVGDVLQAVASYKVEFGVNVDFSTAQSVTFVVS